MLIVSVVLTTVMLGVAVGISRNSAKPFWSLIWTALCGVLVPCCLGLFPAHQSTALLLVIATILAYGSLGWRGMFLPMALGGTLLAYGVTTWMAYTGTRDLLARYPYQSMAARLPHAPEPVPALSPEATQHVAEWEEGVEHAPGMWGSMYWRNRSLEALHERTLEVFVSRPGFGVMRLPIHSDSAFRGSERDGPPVPQPAPGTRPTGDAPGEREALEPAELLGTHRAGLLDFVHPDGFGYFKDREHVAGFRPHGFSRQPEMGKGLRLRTLDLVGLVVHEKPRAYVSDNLPRMDELRDAPTRDLDAFEELALARLRQGETLVSREVGTTIRVLGAVRATKQCVGCHGGERGALLGAFSYTLTRE